MPIRIKRRRLSSRLPDRASGTCTRIARDIVFHSTFPQHEIEKETEVIIDEIQSYEDNPSELIFDDFEDMIFRNHPLGRNILGKPDCCGVSVRRMFSRLPVAFINRGNGILCSGTI